MFHVFLLPIGGFGLFVLLWYLGYAAHIFFVVLSGTAQGKNEVEVYWPTDHFGQRLWNAGYLLALAALGVAPALLFLFLLDLPAEPSLRAALGAIVVGTALWLFLPVVLLSVVSGRSHVEVFRWTVVRELAVQRRSMLAFYALSAPLVIGGVLVMYLATIGWLELVDAAGGAAWTWLPEAVTLWSWAFLLPVTAVLVAAALIIYARLVGRLAWLLELTGDGPPPRPKEITPPPGHFAIYGEEPVAATAPELLGEEIYPLRTEPAASQRTPVSVEPVRLAVMEPVQPLPALVPPPEESNKAPRRLLVRGIYRFPWYRCCLKAWLFLTLVGLFLLVLFRAELLGYL